MTKATAKSLAFLHLCVWGTWFGSMMYTTFVSGIVMYKQLPRQTFRDAQEVLFPAYFRLSTLCVGLLAVLAPLSFPVSPLMWKLLGASLFASILNLLWLEPATTVVMKERAALEKMSPSAALGVYPAGKEAKLKELGGAFGKFHGLSSLFNLSAIVTCIGYGFELIV